MTTLDETTQKKKQPCYSLHLKSLKCYLRGWEGRNKEREERKKEEKSEEEKRKKEEDVEFLLLASLLKCPPRHDGVGFAEARALSLPLGSRGPTCCAATCLLGCALAGSCNQQLEPRAEPVWQGWILYLPG